MSDHSSIREYSFPEPLVPDSRELSSPVSRASSFSRLAASEESLECIPQASQSPSERSINTCSGFLPRQPPVCRLQAPWSVWEDALNSARRLKPGHGESHDPATARWRRMIRHELPLVDVNLLQGDPRALRRAHLVLAFLMHFYVHSDEAVTQATTDKAEKVPKTLAIPLCVVSRMLAIPPVLTYADTVLYNWRLVNPADGFTPANIRIETTFTETDSEQHFYKTSVLIEALGPACLSLMRSSLDEALAVDTLSVARIASNLHVLSAIVDQLRDVLERVRENCDPAVFYWQIRPWMNGGKREMEGVVDPADPERWLVTNYGGPSAGQSTLIHALDVFLGVDHSASGGLAGAPQSPSGQHVSRAVLTGEETFMDRMAAYMPHHHRHFLAQLAGSLAHSSRLVTFPNLPCAATHSIRSLASACSPSSELRLSYNEAVAALGRFRSAHSRIVFLYIVCQSRHPPPAGSAFASAWQAKMEAEGARPPKHLGTGGTDLAKLLKRCKERTANAILDTT